MDMYLFRFSLKERRQADAFERLDTDGKPFSRERWIRDFFSQRREFSHFGSTFVFVPEPMGEKYLPTRITSGWIARAKFLPEVTSPDEGLQPTLHESWRAALILIDPTDH